MRRGTPKTPRHQDLNISFALLWEDHLVDTLLHLHRLSLSLKNTALPVRMLDTKRDVFLGHELQEMFKINTFHLKGKF